jgi:hypothetical protein
VSWSSLCDGLAGGREAGEESPLVSGVCAKPDEAKTSVHQKDIITNLFPLALK